MLFDFSEKMAYLIFKYLLSWEEILFKIWVLSARLENHLGWAYELIGLGCRLLWRSSYHQDCGCCIICHFAPMSYSSYSLNLDHPKLFHPTSCGLHLKSIHLRNLMFLANTPSIECDNHSHIWLIETRNKIKTCLPRRTETRRLNISN